MDYTEAVPKMQPEIIKIHHFVYIFQKILIIYFVFGSIFMEYAEYNEYLFTLK